MPVTVYVPTYTPSSIAFPIEYPEDMGFVSLGKSSLGQYRAVRKNMKNNDQAGFSAGQWWVQYNGAELPGGYDPAAPPCPAGAVVNSATAYFKVSKGNHVQAMQTYCAPDNVFYSVSSGEVYPNDSPTDWYDNNTTEKQIVCQLSATAGYAVVGDQLRLQGAPPFGLNVRVKSKTANTDYPTGIAIHIWDLYVAIDWTISVPTMDIIQEGTLQPGVNTLLNVGVDIYSEGTSSITQKGIIYRWDTGLTPGTPLGPNYGPTEGDPNATLVPSGQSGPGDFYMNVPNIPANKAIFYRAYAKSAAGTGYEADAHWAIPLEAPVVTTMVALNVGSNSATMAGRVTSIGGSALTDKGFYYIETSMSGGDANYRNWNKMSVMYKGTPDIGQFTAPLSSLKANTEYRFCAYAVNAVNQCDGTVMIFTTGQASNVLPALSNPTLTKLSDTSYRVTGSVTSIGDSALTAQGVCYRAGQAPLITDWSIPAGNLNSPFSVDITGLDPTAMYYFRTWAKNVKNGDTPGYSNSVVNDIPSPQKPTVVTSLPTSANGRITGGGTVTDPGQSSVTERGICWNSTGIGGGDPPVVATGKYVAESPLTGGQTFSVITQQLATGMYFVRAYATNSYGTSYGISDYPCSVGTSGTVHTPEVLTNGVTVDAADNTKAQCTGYVNDIGGANVTTRGFVWGTSELPTVSLSTKTVESCNMSAPGGFSGTATGIDQSIPYFVRAYATNSGYTGYGTSVPLNTYRPTTATIATMAAEQIQETSALAGGYVSSEGGNIVDDKGLCWGTSPDVSLEACLASATGGGGAGEFIQSMTGLNPYTMYYYVAYATNDYGTSYGTVLSFTTSLHIDRTNNNMQIYFIREGESPYLFTGDSRYTLLESSDFGYVSRTVNEIDNPLSSVHTQGLDDWGKLREVRLDVRVRGGSAEELDSNVEALRSLVASDEPWRLAVYPTPGMPVSYINVLKSQDFEVPINMMAQARHRLDVSISLTCEPYIYGDTVTLHSGLGNTEAFRQDQWAIPIDMATGDFDAPLTVSAVGQKASTSYFAISEYGVDVLASAATAYAYQNLSPIGGGLQRAVENEWGLIKIESPPPEGAYRVLINISDAEEKQPRAQGIKLLATGYQGTFGNDKNSRPSNYRHYKSVNSQSDAFWVDAGEFRAVSGKPCNVWCKLNNSSQINTIVFLPTLNGVLGIATHNNVYCKKSYYRSDAKWSGFISERPTFYFTTGDDLGVDEEPFTAQGGTKLDAGEYTVHVFSQVSAENLFDNPSGAINLDGWQLSGGDLARVTEVPSVEMPQGSNTALRSSWDKVIQSMPEALPDGVSVGDSLSWGIWLCPGAQNRTGTWKIQMSWYKNLLQVPDKVSTLMTPTCVAGWTQYKGSIAVPSGGYVGFDLTVTYVGTL